MSPVQTSANSCQSRQKILEIAESLFAENGFSQPSLREITSAACVNLASVNYHFGSKENLIAEVLSRAIEPLNRERLRFLNEAEARHAPHPVPVPEILEAMIRPCLEMCLNPQREQINRILVRAFSEKGNFMEEIVEKEWTPICNRFFESLQRSLPAIPEDELCWRMHFVVGSFLHTSCHHRNFTRQSNGLCQFDFESTLRRLIDFCSAGLQSNRTHRNAS